MNDQDVTLGEVYRLCQAIDGKVEKQGSRVNALERDALRIKTIWTATVVVLGFFADSIRHRLGM